MASAFDRKIMERYLTQAEEKRLLAVVDRYKSIDARRDHGWLLLLRATGIRVGTLAGLTVLDAKTALAEGKLTIRPEIAKGGRKHEVYLNKTAAKALRKLLSIRREMGYPEQADGSLVMGRKGYGLSIRSFQARAQQWGKEAGLQGLSPHWLRHTLAMRIMQTSTASDKRGVVQSVLGHRSIASTGIYTMPDKETVQRVMEEVR